MDLTQILTYLQGLRGYLTQIGKNLTCFSGMEFAANFLHSIGVPPSFTANMGFPKGLYF